MSAHHMLKPSIQHSELIYHELLRRGGFGDVYRAIWQSNDLGDIEVAAKKIHIPKNREDISEDLENEIQFLKTLKHPSIIEFYGLAVTSDYVVLVTEFASLGSLFDYLQTKTELPRDLKTKWAIQAAHGLKYLRDNNVLHRDIKSPNLLITANNDMKICDFGISKTLTSTKTTKHSGKGSLKWQAPEIFTDELLSPKADIFALGIVLWEMETCEEPYRNQIACHIMYKVGKNVRPSIPDLCPPALAALIEQCWHGDKDCRPNIEEVLRQLKQQQLQDEDHPEKHGLSDASKSASKKETCSSTSFVGQDFSWSEGHDSVHVGDMGMGDLSLDIDRNQNASLNLDLPRDLPLVESVIVPPLQLPTESDIDILPEYKSSMPDSRSKDRGSSYSGSMLSISTGTQTQRISSQRLSEDEDDHIMAGLSLNGDISPKRSLLRNSRYETNFIQVRSSDEEMLQCGPNHRARSISECDISPRNYYRQHPIGRGPSEETQEYDHRMLRSSSECDTRQRHYSLYNTHSIVGGDSDEEMHQCSLNYRIGSGSECDISPRNIGYKTNLTVKGLSACSDEEMQQCDYRVMSRSECDISPRNIGNKTHLIGRGLSEEEEMHQRDYHVKSNSKCDITVPRNRGYQKKKRDKSQCCKCDIL